MKIRASDFKDVESFCEEFCKLIGVEKLSFLYKNWTDYFCSTFSKQGVIECCEDYYTAPKINKNIVRAIESLHDEEECDNYLEED
jgi:hypothetical protein